MKTIDIKFQQDNVEDLSKNYLNETKESYKLKTLEILNNSNTIFSEFTSEQAKATDISRLIGVKQGAMLNEQLTMLGLHHKSNNENIHKSGLIGAPDLEPKVLGGMAA